MKYWKEVILSVYGVLLIIAGVLCVPVYMVWGNQERNVDSLAYKPLWELMEYNHVINGFTPRYELCIERCIYQVAIVTLIMVTVYLLLNVINKKKDL